MFPEKLSGKPFVFFSVNLVQLICLVFVLLVYHICYGISTVFPWNTSWLMSIKHDWGAHYLGWLFYRNEPWHFPIGDIQSYFFPVGTNIAFTDSIPLLAVFFKIFSFILPADFQYFGIWLVFCHLLVAHFTILLCRRFNINDLNTIFIVLFMAANPVLIYRGLHPALCAHWMLLASVYLYFVEPAALNAKKVLKYQFLLLLLASWINPYICFMVMGFNLILAIKFGFIQRLISKKNFVFYLLASIAGIFITGLILGTFSFSQKENVAVEGGYGLYGLNLHSLYNSFGFSRFFPRIDQVSDYQYEGFMYLGLGLMLIFFLTLLIYLVKKWIRKETVEPIINKPEQRIWWPLLILMISFSLFAITHVVTFNDSVLFRIDLPKFLVRMGDIFRASARFFWPVYYVLIFFVFVKLIRSSLDKRILVPILIACLVIQFYDIQRIFTYRNLGKGKYNPSISSEWNTIFSSFDTIITYPPFQTTYLEPMDYQDFSWYAGKSKKNISTGYVARINETRVRDFNLSVDSLILDGHLPRKTLFITTQKNLEKFSALIQSGKAMLSSLDNYFFIFSETNKDPGLLKIFASLNEKNKNFIEGAVKSFTPLQSFEQLHNFNIRESAPIKFNLEHFSKKENWIYSSGWAFLENINDNKSDSIFLMLRSDDKQYISPAGAFPRPDVTKHFNAVNLDNSGFEAKIFTDKVEKGRYEVLIAIKNKSQLYTTSTGKIVEFKMDPYTILTPVQTLSFSKDMFINIETINEQDSSFFVQGWAIIRNKPLPNKNKIYLLLKQDDQQFIGETELMLRPDVSNHFNQKLDSCGFKIKFLKSGFLKGNFQLGVVMKQAEHNVAGWSDKELNFR